MRHLMRFLALPTLIGLATSAIAESQRTLFTTENRFPRWEQLEVGAFYRAWELETETDEMTAGAYVRYGIRENLALSVDIPYREVDPAFGDSESGLGDVEVELQIRTYEDIFGYPFFIPYVRVLTPTGDEDKGLGTGETVIVPGMAYGGKINDWIDWVLDVGYRIHPDEDNQLLVGHSYVWNVSDAFGLVTEIAYEEEVEGADDSSVLVSGGFSYHWNRNLRMGAHAGGGLTGPVDAFGEVRFSYSF